MKDRGDEMTTFTFGVICIAICVVLIVGIWFRFW